MFILINVLMNVNFKKEKDLKFSNINEDYRGRCISTRDTEIDALLISNM